jgi:sporulation protein YlmC with PRC-barrel domain
MRNLLTPTALGLSLLLTPALSFAEAAHNGAPLPSQRLAVTNEAAGTEHSLSALPAAHPAADGAAATANTAAGTEHGFSALPNAGNRAGTLGAAEPEKTAKAPAKPGARTNVATAPNHKAAVAEANKTNAIPAAAVEKMVGKPVRNRDGQQLGTLDKVIAGPNGQIEKLVISHGGFFGLFQSQSEISWQFAKPEIKGNQLLLAISPEQVASAPSYNAAGH